MLFNTHEITSFKQLLGEEKFERLAKYEYEQTPLDPYKEFDYPTEQPKPKVQESPKEDIAIHINEEEIYFQILNQNTTWFKDQIYELYKHRSFKTQKKIWDTARANYRKIYLLFNFLDKHNITTEYITNVRNYKKKYPQATPFYDLRKSNLITHAFLFIETLEGWSYWNNINTKWISHITLGGK